MTRRVVLTETAREDLADAWEFYAQDSPAAADRMVDALLERLRELETMPELGRRRHELRPGVRSLLIGRYLAFYTVDGEAVKPGLSSSPGTRLPWRVWLAVVLEFGNAVVDNPVELRGVGGTPHWLWQKARFGVRG